MGLDSCLRQGLLGGGSASGEEGPCGRQRERPGCYHRCDRPICLSVADFNTDGNVDITDPVIVLVYLFQGGVDLEPLSAGELEECVAGVRAAELASCLLMKETE